MTNSMAEEILATYNNYWAEIGAPLLAWSGTLASEAQEGASQFCKYICEMLQKAMTSVCRLEYALQK